MSYSVELKPKQNICRVKKTRSGSDSHSGPRTQMPFRCSLFVYTFHLCFSQGQWSPEVTSDWRDLQANSLLMLNKRNLKIKIRVLSHICKIHRQYWSHFDYLVDSTVTCGLGRGILTGRAVQRQPGVEPTSATRRTTYSWPPGQLSWQATSTKLGLLQTHWMSFISELHARHANEDSETRS